MKIEIMTFRFNKVQKESNIWFAYSLYIHMNDTKIGDNIVTNIKEHEDVQRYNIL